MQKRTLFLPLCTLCFYAVVCASDERSTASTITEDLQQLSEPYRYVSGAYYGVGVGISKIPHRVTLLADDNKETTMKHSANQPDLSLIGGFGATFYKSYYAGIEIDIFKRFSNKKKFENGLGILHSPLFGLSVNLRFGYQLPRLASLIYVTAGFAKVQGKAVFENPIDSKSGPTASFGSYYPTFGIGIERRLNYCWNIRLDSKFSLTKKKWSECIIDKEGNSKKYAGKPGRCSIMISLTRNI